MATSDNDFSSSLLGWRGLDYIVLSSEFGLSDQTDIDRTVFFDPLGRWIQEFGSDWPRGQGGRPRGRAGALPRAHPVSRSFPWFLYSSRLRKIARHVIISL